MNYLSQKDTRCSNLNCDTKDDCLRWLQYEKDIENGEAFLYSSKRYAPNMFFCFHKKTNSFDAGIFTTSTSDNSIDEDVMIIGEETQNDFDGFGNGGEFGGGGADGSWEDTIDNSVDSSDDSSYDANDDYSDNSGSDSSSD